MKDYTEAEKMLSKAMHALEEMMGLVRAIDADYEKNSEYLLANKTDEQIASYFRNRNKK